MTHDAGTSYYASSTCEITKALADYVMTQAPGTFSEQLDCGARAFDLRPHQDGGKLWIHHGAIDIKHVVSDVLAEVINWASRHPDEFVFIYGSHCSGGDMCVQMFSDALKAVQIQQIECSDISSLTLGSAHERGKLPGGGSVLATWGCVEENYNASITCYGELTKAEHSRLKNPTTAEGTTVSDAISGVDAGVPKISWSCYGEDAEKAFEPFWAYMAKTSDGSGKNQGNLWMAQGHWQYDASSVVQGELLRSCILLDESKAAVNQKLAQKIRQGQFPHINLLEVDNVCDGHGLELLEALRGRFAYDLGKTSSGVLV